MPLLDFPADRADRRPPDGLTRSKTTARCIKDDRIDLSGIGRQRIGARLNIRYMCPEDDIVIFIRVNRHYDSGMLYVWCRYGSLGLDLNWTKKARSGPLRITFNIALPEGGQRYGDTY